MISKKNFPPPFFYLLAIFLGLLVLGLTGIFRPVRGLVEKTLVVPLKEKVYGWQRVFKKDLGEGALRNERELSELKVKIASLQQENQELRRLLSAPLPKNWQFLPVKVIGVEGENLTIDMGGRDGVTRGMVAVLGDAYLGRVDDVSERIAKIKLASSWEEKLAVKIVDRETGQISGQGLLIGRSQGRMKIEQILSTEETKKGDLVIVNLEGGDLLIGEVEEVFITKGEPFKTAAVKRLFNPEELNTIFLVRGKL